MDLLARNPNPQKYNAGGADRASKHEKKGDNPAMERFLLEDDHLKKSLVVGKDNDKHKDIGKSSSLGKGSHGDRAQQQ